jgi:hypothetical protein
MEKEAPQQVVALACAKDTALLDILYNRVPITNTIVAQACSCRNPVFMPEPLHWWHASVTAMLLL